MIESQRIQRKIAEGKVALKEAADAVDDNPDDDQKRSALEDLESTQLDLEKDLAKALREEEAAKSKARSADKGFNTLRETAKEEGGWLEAAMAGSELRGAADEFTKEITGGQTHGPQGGVWVPLGLYDQEQLRTAGDTRVQDLGTVPENQSPRNIIPLKYARQNSQTVLGLEMQMPPVGTLITRFTKAGAVSGDGTEGTDSIAQRMTIDSRADNPEFIIGSVSLTRLAQYRDSGLEAWIMQELEAATSSKIEDKVIAELETITAGATPSNASVFKDYAALADGYVDGVYAATGKDCRVLIPVSLWAVMAEIYNSDESESAIDAMRRTAGMIGADARLTPLASNAAQVIMRRGDDPDQDRRSCIGVAPFVGLAAQPEAVAGAEAVGCSVNPDVQLA